jgi:hypothetical protein
MRRTDTPPLFLVRWRCEVTGRRRQVVGDFDAVEKICNRLKRRGLSHHWTVCTMQPPARRTPRR